MKPLIPCPTTGSSPLQGPALSRRGFLELVDQQHHPLFGHVRPPGQLGEAGAGAAVDVHEERRVPGPDLLVAALGEAR